MRQYIIHGYCMRDDEGNFLQFNSRNNGIMEQIDLVVPPSLQCLYEDYLELDYLVKATVGRIGKDDPWQLLSMELV